MAAGVLLGQKLRRLRRDRGASQVDVARQLGISPSYLNLIEHNQRQLTLPLLLKVSRLFEVELDAFSDEDEGRILGDIVEVFGDPLFGASGVTREELTDLVGAAPAACQAVVELYRAYRTASDNVQAMRERLSGDEFVSSSIHELLTLLTSIRSFSEILDKHADLDPEERRRFVGIILAESQRLTEAVGQLVELARGDALAGIFGSRPPIDEVNEFIERYGNHFPLLEDAADRLRAQIGLDPVAAQRALAGYLQSHHGLAVERVAGGAAGLDGERHAPDQRTVLLDEALPPNSVNFRLAHRIALLSHGDLLDECMANEEFASPEAESVCRRSLAGYLGAAMLLPYEPFIEAARATRYDIARLQRQFGAGFEQICHRLTTLQRPGDAGIPLHFVRVDIAGNISKRYGGSGLRIPRFGSACPLWAAHAAFLAPGRIHTQIGALFGGATFFSVARTVAKPAGGHHAPQSLYAVEIGCEIGHARDMVYSDGLAIEHAAAHTPIGITCRLCERAACRQRAHPPLAPGAGSGRAASPPPAAAAR